LINFSKILLLVCVIFFTSSELSSQKLPGKGKNSSEETDIKNQNQDQSNPTQSVISTDSLKVSNDSLEVNAIASKSGLDSVVTYSATDTVVFRMKSKKMRLRGDAKLNFKQQNLESEIIVLSLTESLLTADGVEDSLGKIRGYPKFTDKGETFYGKTIKYNFKSKKGSIVFGETEVDDGFYFAERIKKKSENDLYLENGCFTSCDDPHPHYYFGSPKMEVIVKDRVFVDPIIFYVEDMPVFAVPFGMFFSMQSGRKSGLIIPSFFFSDSRGVTLENFGVYLALSDYYDTRFTMDFFSKGGFTFKNYTQWKYQDILSGNLALEFGRTRFNPNEEYAQNYRILFNHNQSFSPNERIVANLNFSSQDYNRNTQWDQNQRIIQEITSNASYSKSFDNGSSFAIAYNRNQNIINGSYTQTPNMSFTLPQYSPFKSMVSSDNWLRDITLSYSGNASYTDRRTVTEYSTGDTTISDTLDSWSSKVTHSPRLSITLPKISYFTFTPYVNFGLNNYFRKATKFYDTNDSTEKTSYQDGFFSEYTYSAGLSMSTRIYGMAKPKIFGVNAIRHTLQPNFSFSFRPNQSDPSLGFYDTYYNPETNTSVTYSRYQADGGGIASRQFSSSLNYSFVNNIQAKIAQGDTLEDKSVDLLSFNIGGNYDFAKSYRRLSDINVSFHSTTLPGVNFSGSSRFTPYDEVWVADSITQQWKTFQTNNLLISEGKGLARMTNLTLSLSTGFNSQGEFSTSPNQDESLTSDSISLGDRFAGRINHADDDFDFHGDNNPGYSKFVLPWSLNFNINYNYSRPSIAIENQSLTVGSNFTFNITPTWYFNGSVQFDLLSREILSPVINIRKDLHCWELNFTWYPVGFNQGFYLRFNIKSPLLKDLKWEQRSSDFF